MIKYLNYISIYLKIKQNTEKLKALKTKYLEKANKITNNNDIINKHIYKKIIKRLIKIDKIINNEINKNSNLIKCLNKTFKKKKKFKS